MTEAQTGYEYWAAKLRGEDPDPPTDRTQMPLGFWRLRDNRPMAVWMDGERRVALTGFAGSQAVMSEQRMQAQAEMGAFGQAVAEAAYRAAFAAGAWPDDPPAVGAGHNMPDDPLEAIRTELQGEIETTAEFLAAPITSQADADKCSTWARRVGLLAKRADETREQEKAPHLMASREVDERWRDIIAAAKDLTAKLKRHVEPFLIAKKRADDEAAAKARAEAEALRRQAAEADRRDDAERAELIAKAQAAERKAAPKNASAGRPNMKVALRTKTRARIVDYDAALVALKDHPDMRILVGKLADRAVKAGVPLAGVEVEEYEEAA